MHAGLHQVARRAVSDAIRIRACPFPGCQGSGVGFWSTDRRGSRPCRSEGGRRAGRAASRRGDRSSVAACSASPGPTSDRLRRHHGQRDECRDGASRAPCLPPLLSREREGEVLDWTEQIVTTSGLTCPLPGGEGRSGLHRREAPSRSSPAPRIPSAVSAPGGGSVPLITPSASDLGGRPSTSTTRMIRRRPISRLRSSSEELAPAPGTSLGPRDASWASGQPAAEPAFQSWRNGHHATAMTVKHHSRTSRPQVFLSVRVCE